MSTPILPQAEPRRWAMFVILLVGAFLPPLDFFYRQCCAACYSERAERLFLC